MVLVGPLHVLLESEQHRELELESCLGSSRAAQAKQSDMSPTLSVNLLNKAVQPLSKRKNPQLPSFTLLSCILCLKVRFWHEQTAAFPQVHTRKSNGKFQVSQMSVVPPHPVSSRPGDSIPAPLSTSLSLQNAGALDGFLS